MTPETATATPTPAAPPPMSPVERAMAALDPKPAPEPKPEAKAEPPKEEAKPEAKAEEKPEPKKDPTIAERFAFMAKKEKAIVERDRAIKDREAKLAEREAAIKAQEEKWAADPLSALSAKGISYEDLTKYVLDKTDPSAKQAVALRQLAEQVEQAKREAAAAREAIEKAKAESERAEVERTRAGFKTEVAQHVKANPEKYELVNLYGQENLVYAVIEAEYEKTGEMLGFDAAAEKVEKYLESEAEKAFKAKKFAARFATPAVKPPVPTLTNTTPAPGPARSRMTESERMAAAIAALKD